MMMSDMQKVKERVMIGEGYLHVKRLPKNTVSEMIDFLNNSDEFGGDWGMGVKYIWDTFKGMMPPKDGALLSEIERLELRIEALEAKLGVVASEKKPSRRLADGSKR
jgi:hypothetical protein